MNNLIIFQKLQPIQYIFHQKQFRPKRNWWLVCFHMSFQRWSFNKIHKYNFLIFQLQILRLYILNPIIPRQIDTKSALHFPNNLMFMLYLILKLRLHLLYCKMFFYNIIWSLFILLNPIFWIIWKYVLKDDF